MNSSFQKKQCVGGSNLFVQCVGSADLSVQKAPNEFGVPKMQKFDGGSNLFVQCVGSADLSVQKAPE
jgi:hypothetical protein